MYCKSSLFFQILDEPPDFLEEARRSDVEKIYDVFTSDEELELEEKAIFSVPLHPKCLLRTLNQIDKWNEEAVLWGEAPRVQLYGFQRSTKTFVPYPKRAYLAESDGSCFSIPVSKIFSSLIQPEVTK